MTKKFAPKQFQRLNTALMLGKKAEQEKMKKEVMAKMRRWQMQVYLNVLMLLFNNAGNMSRAEYKEAVKRFAMYEKALAMVYFACGTCRHLSLLHSAYKRLKR